jgi:hypothetical protein
MQNRYTKKPITITAFDFSKTKIDDKGKYLYDGIEKREDGKEWHFINTLEGKHYIKEDDFIIFGIKGEKYPCKRDIFFATYQKEEEEFIDII